MVSSPALGYKRGDRDIILPIISGWSKRNTSAHIVCAKHHEHPFHDVAWNVPKQVSVPNSNMLALLISTSVAQNDSFRANDPPC